MCNFDWTNEFIFKLLLRDKEHNTVIEFSLQKERLEIASIVLLKDERSKEILEKHKDFHRFLILTSSAF